MSLKSYEKTVAHIERKLSPDGCQGALYIVSGTSVSLGLESRVTSRAAALFTCAGVTIFIVPVFSEGSTALLSRTKMVFFTQ